MKLSVRIGRVYLLKIITIVVFSLEETQHLLLTYLSAKRVLAVWTTFRHCRRSSATFFQLLAFSLFTSSSTESIHLLRGLPLVRAPIMLQLVLRTFFAPLSSSILVTWLAHRSLDDFIAPTIVSQPNNSLNSLLFLVLQTLFSWIGTQILRNIFLSEVLSVFSRLMVKVQVSLPYITIGLIIGL